jgi:hypothetical protein
MPSAPQLEILTNDSAWTCKNHSTFCAAVRQGAIKYVRRRSLIAALNRYEKSFMQTRTQLTAEEERARDRAMDFYRFIGKTELEAMRLAWEDVEKAFPRLRACDSQ